MAANPYVGPRAFRRDDPYPPFGREQETRELRALVVSEEAAVLYAESGAGKTSLVNALLVPELEKKGFEILAVKNLAGLPPAGVTPRNVYVWNLVSSLGSEETDAGPAESLEAFLARRGEGAEPRRRVIILDQLEEMLSVHSERGDERADFFRELQAALEADPRLRVLLVIREDRIAELDDYARLFRHRLEGRLRIRRLSREAAVDALRRPAALAGRPFAPGVAEDLAERLSMERVAGRTEPLPGELVEPIVLQVAAYQLWSSVEERYGPVAEMRREHLEEVGDVHLALERFYDEAVAATAGRGTADEEEIRRWLERTAITPQNLRAQVSYDPEEPATAGLPTATVRELIDQHHLLRPVEARGGRWVQLVHDRFVDPIRLSNARWLERRSPLSAAARSYAAGDRQSLELFRGRRLEEELARIKHHPELFSPVERGYLDAAKKRKDARSRRTAAVVIALVFAVLFVSYLFQLHHEATRQEIFLARQQLTTSPEESLRTTLAASDRFLATTTFPEDLSDLLRGGLHALRSRRLWARPVDNVSGCFAWSAGGRRLASAQSEGTTTLWDAGAGEIVATFDTTELQPVRWLATSPDGTRVAVFGRAGAQLWTAGTATKVDLPGAPETTDAAAFSPDGNRLAAVGDDGPLRIWDTASGVPLEAPAQARLSSLAWSPDGRYLATGDLDGNLYLASLDSGRLLGAEPVPAHGVAVHGMAFSPDGGELVSAGEDGAILWSTEPLHSRATLLQDQRSVDLAFSDDGHYLLILTVDDTIHAFNRHHADVPEVASFPPVPRPWATPEDQPVPGGLSSNGRRLARRGLTLLELFLEETPTWAGDQDDVLAVSISDDGRQLATAGADRTVRLRDNVPAIDAGDVRPRVLRGHGRDVRSVAWSRDGRLLASGSDDRTARIWDVASGEGLHTLGGHAGPVLGLAFSDDGSRLTTADLREDFLRTWDTASGELLRQSPVEGGLDAVAVSPRGDPWVIRNRNGILVWDLEAGEAASSFPLPETSAEAKIAVAGRYLAAADEDVSLWDLGTGRLLAPSLPRPDTTTTIQALAFSPDGRRLAAAEDTGVLVWDVSSLALLAVVPARRHGVRCIAWSAGGRYLASAGDDGLTRLEPLELEDLSRLARQRLRTR